MPEGRVGIGGGDVAGGAVELADVLGEVPTVCMPSAADLDSQRASSDGLRRVPGEQPRAGVMTTGEVNAGDLQGIPCKYNAGGTSLVDSLPLFFCVRQGR